MRWIVYVEDFNAKQIKEYNIFQHEYFFRECVMAAEILREKSDFAAQIERILMYYFGYKCEWEIILSDFPPSDKFQEKKVDVYHQVMLNFPIFIDYIWNNKDTMIAEYKKEMEDKHL